MKNLLVIGAACADVMLRLDHLPITGEDINLQAQDIAMGGCGYNAAMCAFANGIDVTLLSPVGTSGIYSSFVKNKLKDLGMHGPYKAEGENGCTYCLVEQSGERTFLSLHGVEYGFDPSAIKQKHYDYVYVSGLQLEEKDGDRIIHWLKKADIWNVIYAPGPRIASIAQERTEALLAMHAMVHCNEHEIVSFPGCQGLSVTEAALHVWQMSRQAVIVTMGEKGTFYIDQTGQAVHAGTNKAAVVDTIGAGDAHCSAWMTALCMGMDLKDAVCIANLTAKEVCETACAVLPLDHYCSYFQKEKAR